LGSISQKVLTEARRSVRIARGRIDVDPAPQRVVIGFDGTKGAEAAVDAAMSRNWQFGTEIRLIAVSDPITPTAIGRFLPPVTRVISEINVSENRFLEKRAEKALNKLEAAGLSADLKICPGNPKTVLVDEAENWSADCIFVGANAQGSDLARFLIGSTSAAVAARAKCSVEVIRKQQRPSSPAETKGSDGAKR
jgi:nucleotide-binding universal stress UspA family protein